jgi:hypothetical protein
MAKSSETERRKIVIDQSEVLGWKANLAKLREKLSFLRCDHSVRDAL